MASSSRPSTSRNVVREIHGRLINASTLRSRTATTRGPVRRQTGRCWVKRTGLRLLERPQMFLGDGSGQPPSSGHWRNGRAPTPGRTSRVDPFRHVCHRGRLEELQERDVHAGGGMDAREKLHCQEGMAPELEEAVVDATCSTTRSWAQILASRARRPSGAPRSPHRAPVDACLAWGVPADRSSRWASAGVGRA